jgi:hypothetical protein
VANSKSRFFISNFNLFSFSTISAASGVREIGAAGCAVGGAVGCAMDGEFSSDESDAEVALSA